MSNSGSIQLTSPPRKLSARPTSSTASDPYATNSPHPPSLASSILTIVKVNPDSDIPSSSSRRAIAARNNQSVDQNPGRISFANPFSSLGGKSPQITDSTTSAKSTFSGGPSHLDKPNLTPDEIYQLAKQSIDPSAPSPSILHERSNSHSPASSRGRTGSHSSPTSSNFSTPATFTPLEDTVYLPFIDRPVEVTKLITTLPTLKLFVLLDKTLPKDPDADSDVPDSLYNADQLPKDPRRWTYDHLYKHLSSLTREECPDALWVAQARMCLMSHSETLWERLKGALGVPVELDHPMTVEQLFIEMQRLESLALEEKSKKEADTSNPRHALSRMNRQSTGAISDMNTDEISDDEGMQARGHWKDWDWVMDSPVYARRGSFGSAGLPSSTSISGLTPLDISRGQTPPRFLEEDRLKSHVDNRLSTIQKSPLQAPPQTLEPPEGADTGATVTSVPTPRRSSSPLRIATDATTEHGRPQSILSPTTRNQTLSPDIHTHYTASAPLNISAILKSPGSPIDSHFPPTSLHGISSPPSAERGLGDIFEDEEDTKSPPRPLSTEDAPQDIQGLRFSIDASPIPLYSSLSRMDAASPLGAADQEENFPSPRAEREPGVPLFPSSFARLARSPTLSANSVALRSPSIPSASRSKTRSFLDPQRKAGHFARNLQLSRPSEAGSSDWASDA